MHPLRAAIICTQPSDMTAYTVSGEVLTHGSFAVTLACASDYETADGNAPTAACTTSGAYTISNPCAAIVCTRPLGVTPSQYRTITETNLDLSAGAFNVTLLCADGYSSVSGASAACVTSGDYGVTDPCTVNICTCANGGTAATGTDCPIDAGAKCMSCTGAFYLSDESCVAHTADCDASGKIVAVVANNVADEQCGADKWCACANSGTGATGTTCPVNGDFKCTACTGTFYLSNDTCVAWQTCGPGYGRVSGSGSNMADIQCEVCADADKHYSEGEDRSECADHVQCPVGQGSTYESLVDPEQEAGTCAPCGDGTFSATLGYGPCEPHSMDCDALGMVVATVASAAADEQCGEDKQCTCDNGGTAANGTDCLTDGYAKCSACLGGFRLTVEKACRGTHHSFVVTDAQTCVMDCRLDIHICICEKKEILPPCPKKNAKWSLFMASLRPIPTRPTQIEGGFGLFVNERCCAHMRGL
jgi:hypothetical protein